MKKSNKRKLIVFVSLVLALVYMITAYYNSINEDGVENLESVIPQESEPVLEPTTPPTPKKYVGNLELPVIGATGYTSITLDLKTSANPDSETIKILEAGTAFKIIGEEGNWWQIQNDDSSGWIQHKYCLINLPDVIPSIIYNNTNTYSSEYMSSGKSIPNITGKSLYSGKTFNVRLEKKSFLCLFCTPCQKRFFLHSKTLYQMAIL